MKKKLDFTSDAREMFIVDNFKLKKKAQKMLIENCTFPTHNHNKLNNNNNNNNIFMNRT